MVKCFRSVISRLNGTYRKEHRDMLLERMAAIPPLREAIAAASVRDTKIAAIPDMLEGFLRTEMRF